MYSSAQSPDQLDRIEQEAIRLSEEIKAEYWAVSAKSGERVNHAVPSSPHPLLRPCMPQPLSLCLINVPGDGIRDLFFRVASLTFEAIVLSELEKSGSRHAGDIISESVCSLKSCYVISIFTYKK